jgi:hypothetical protein
MTPSLALLIIFAGLSVFGLMAATLLTLRLRKLTRLLELQAAEKESDEFGPPADSFLPLLRQADLQARLQQGRQRREMPEKYRFIRSLAERGVPEMEIAGILNLAPGEVEQLMALARVASRQPPPAAKPSRPKKSRALIKSKDSPPPAEMVVSGQ